MLVEVCCNALESALNAQAAGADRIELCSELGIGGITPSYGVLQLVLERLTIPVHVLLRPRSGHFTYSDTEFEVLQQDLEACKELGVAGIVSGVLHADGTLDRHRTQQLVAQAKPLQFTFHRAFDWIPNKEEAILELEAMGVDTVLSSGGETTAKMGLEVLKSLKQSLTRLELMPGAGINDANAHIFKEAGFNALHFSGTDFTNRITSQPPLSFTSEKHLQEQQIAVTNEDIVRQIVQIVK